MKQRIVTGLILAVLFLSILQIGGYAFALLIIALALVGFHEFMKINGIRTTSPSSLFGILGVLALTIPWFMWENENFRIPSVTAVIWCVMLLLLFATVWSKNKISLKEAAVVLIGVVYIGIGFYYMTYTRIEYGLFWSYFLFVCIWLTDIGAYFTGRAFGKRPLWPAISPKKTVEGAIGGISFAVAAAIILSLLPYAPDNLSLVKAAGLGLVISIVGQIGDLIQSAYKRLYGVKDSGTIFPGHGGVLDRTDSWLIAFPFLHLLTLI